MPRTIIANLQHFLDNGELPASLPTPALKLARHLGSIVAWVTSHPIVGAQRTNVACRCSPGRRPCRGDIIASHDRLSDLVSWECPVCGEGGTIDGWRDTQWDCGMALPSPAAAAAEALMLRVSGGTGTAPAPAPQGPTVTITFNAGETALLGQAVLDFSLVDRLVALPGGKEWSGTYELGEIDDLVEDVALAANGAEETKLRKRLEVLSDRLEMIQIASEDSSWHDRAT